MFSISASASASVPKKKLALVTGTTDGIGKHTARRLVEQKIDVIVHGRTRERIEKAVEEINEVTGGGKGDGGKVVGAILSDLSTLEGVENLFESLHRDVVEKENRKLDIVVQNAGVFLPERKTNDRKIELTFQINVLAPYMLNALLWNNDALDEDARILNVASISQTSGIQLDDLTFEKQWSDHWSYSHPKTHEKFKF